MCLLLCKSTAVTNLGVGHDKLTDVEAEGREAEETETVSPAQPRLTTREICVPRVFEGTLQYTLMEFVESGTGNYWAVRYKMPPPHQQHQQQAMVVATSMVTSDTPRPVMSAGIPGHHGHHHMAPMVAAGF